MSKRTFILIVAGFVVTAVAVVAIVLNQASSSGGSPSSGEAKQPDPPRVYAYMAVHFGQDWTETHSELVAMNGTRRIGHVSFGWLGTEPAFTTDGRYVFTLVDDRVLAISATTGKVTKVPCDGCQDRSLKCHCQAVVPFGAAKVAWVGKGNHLVLADLGATAPAPRRTAMTVPAWHPDGEKGEAPHLLAGGDGIVLAAYEDSLSPEAAPAYLVTPDSAPRRLAPHPGDILPAAAFSPDGSRVALTGGEPGSCATVTVMDVGSGTGTTSPVMAAAGAKCPTSDGAIGDLWWDPDGGLNVYFQPDDEQHTLNGVQRRLTGGRWGAADVKPDGQAHRLAAGATALLSRPGVRDRDFLYFETGGRSTKIQGNVNPWSSPHASLAVSVEMGQEAGRKYESAF